MLKLKELVDQASFWTLVDESERLLTWLLAKKKKSYLQVAKLASWQMIRKNRIRVLRILEVLWTGPLASKVRQILQDLLEARKMWQANVSFQNAMEYLVLKKYKLILFENQIQTTSTSPCRTQVQPAAGFLVCSLIFIEY